MKLYSINSGYFKLDGGAMFGVVPKSIWNRINPADENNLCSWALRCLLIEDNGRLILVDSGIGNKQDKKFFSYYHLHGNDTLDGSLSRHGFHPDDITDVLLTHLHFDHCGGSIVREGNQLVPAFKNATYWSNRVHWETATHPNDRERASFLGENILPIRDSGRLKFIDVAERQQPGIPSTAFSENVSVLFVYGHTQAMMLPKIEYNGRIVVYMADLLPSHGHIPMPYIMAYDMQPLVTLAEKKIVLGEAVAGSYTLFFEHDPNHECCSVEQTEKGIRPKEFFNITDLA